MTAEQELFRRAGETPLDAWMLAHPCVVLLWIPALCVALALYVLWATDPRSRFLVRVCAWHPGGQTWRPLHRWPRFGRACLGAVTVAQRLGRLPAALTHGVCPECFDRLESARQRAEARARDAYLEVLVREARGEVR